MKKKLLPTFEIPDLKRLDADQLRTLMAQMAGFVQASERHIEAQDHLLREREQALKIAEQRIALLEEVLRLRKIEKFAASSEKSDFQLGLFDEAELNAAIGELVDRIPAEDNESKPLKELRRERKSRQRAFSPALPRKRIELRLGEEEKRGASKTFFTLVKEELEYIPAQLNVLEYWQEKAVFPSDEGDQVVMAKRPIHPLGKCTASLALIVQIILAKYADGLPLYRQEAIFRRLGHEIRRATMARWIIDLLPAIQPLLERYRAIQNSASYLQADETRIQVLKESGKTAQSDKWMWLTRGGPPGWECVLFEYAPTRAGKVATDLFKGFTGILQADGYGGYAPVCAQKGLTRIGCWDHARRKFVEASRAGISAKPPKGKVPLAEEALDQIRALYRIESKLDEENASDAERLAVRKKTSLPRMAGFKVWLEQHERKVMKDGLLHKAIRYSLNQWEHLIGYCERGDLKISNALVENAIRPFAVGRRNWLFADTTHGAEASAAWYSLIETAKMHQLNPQAYLHYVLANIATADTTEKLDQLLAWNVKSKLATLQQADRVA